MYRVGNGASCIGLGISRCKFWRETADWEVYCAEIRMEATYLEVFNLKTGTIYIKLNLKKHGIQMTI